MPLDDTEIGELIAQQNKALAELRATHEESMKRRDNADIVAQEKVANISAALDKMEDRVARAETAAARPMRQDDNASRAASLHLHNRLMATVLQRRGQAVTEFNEAHMQAHRAGFVQFLRTANPVWNDEQRQAMSVGSDPDGGYLVPADMTGRIVTRIFDLSPIRQISAVQPIGSDALEGIVDNDEMGGGWVGETAARSETTTATLGKYRIAAEEVYAYPRTTQKLLDDAAVDVESWLATKIADKHARMEGNAFIVGDGVSKPRGFATYTTAATADSARAWGTLEHIKSGANGAFATTNPADVLIQLVEAMKDGYRDGCQWVTRRSVVQAIRLFKEATTNAYIWQPGLAQGQPPTLLGYPVVKAEDMPALATSSLSLAFGNFAEAYQIVDRLGVRVVRDNITQPGFVKFYTYRRVGGAVVNSEAIKFILFAS